MKSPFILEFSQGLMQTEFPASNEPGGDRASYITYESPRLTVAAPFEGRPKGSDRAICRTVNGIVKVKLLNKDILNSYTDDPDAFFRGRHTPIITACLCGESSGVEGVIALDQYFCSASPEIGNSYRYVLDRRKSTGDLGFKILTSYSNLMQNIFIRVTIQRGPQTDGYTPNKKLKINAVCSGVLIGADLR